MFWRKSHHRHTLKQLLDSRKSVNELPKTKNNYKFELQKTAPNNSEYLKAFSISKIFHCFKKGYPYLRKKGHQVVFNE